MLWKFVIINLILSKNFEVKGQKCPEDLSLNNNKKLLKVDAREKHHGSYKAY